MNNNVRNLYLANSVVALVFALGLLLGPATVLQLFGLSTGNSEKLVAQLLGSVLVAIGLLTWFARDITDSATQDSILISLFFSDVVALVVSLLGTMAKVMKDAGWIVVLLFLLFAVGHAYFRFFNRGSQ